MEFENERERQHCRLDLHTVEMGSMTPDAWVARWGGRLDDLLLNGDARTAEMREEARAAQGEATEAEAARDKLAKAIDQAIKAGEAEHPDPEAALDAVLEILEGTL